MRNRLVNSVLDAEREGKVWAVVLVTLFFLVSCLAVAILTFYILLTIWEVLT